MTSIASQTGEDDLRDRLFTIDVDAEIRKLAGRRFKTRGEAFVELIRMACGTTPRRVDLHFARSRFVLHAHNAAFPSDQVRLLAQLSDRRLSAFRRHSALTELERDFGLDILAAIADEPRQVAIAWVDGTRSHRLVIRQDRPPTTGEADIIDGFSITVEQRIPRLSRVRNLVAEACRQSPIPIRLDGREISQGLSLRGCLLTANVSNSRMESVVGLPLEGDLCEITLLRHGILVERVIRPPKRGLIFSAIVEQRDASFESTWSALRRYSRELYSRLPSMYEQLDRDRRRRVVELLFGRYHYAKEPGLLAGVHAFDQVNGPNLDLDQLIALADSGPICAVDVHSTLDSYDVGSRVVLRLDATARRFLDEDPRILLVPPPPRARRLRHPRGPLHLARDLLRAAGGWLQRRKGHPLQDSDLTQPERHFLEALRAELRAGHFALPEVNDPYSLRVVMASGSYPALRRIDRHRGPIEVRISRDHPLVRNAVRAVGVDATAIYAVTLALSEGHDGYRDRREERQAVILKHYEIS